MVPSLLLSQVGKISNILRRNPLYLKNGTLHKQTVFRFGISEVELFMIGYLNEMLVIFDHGARSFAVQRRLRSPNFRGGPIYRKRYFPGKNGFHILNQRGRFSLDGLSK